MSLTTRIMREAVERLGAFIFSVIVFVILSSTALRAQSSINRPYEPQVLQGTAFPNFSNDIAPINQQRPTISDLQSSGGSVLQNGKASAS